MQPRAMGHGCLALFAGACLALAADEESSFRVRSRFVEIDYQIDNASLPLDYVQLWYTLDRGNTWHAYGFDEDRRPPFTFTASAEGLHGFFLRASNRTGVSSEEPGSSTDAHLWAFVDYTPPVVQLHPVRQTTSLGQRILQIRWTAIDAHLTSRPVEIQYCQLAVPGSATGTLGSLANTGRYDWRVPEHLGGPLRVRLYVSDQGGHRVASEDRTVDVARIMPPEASSALAERSGGNADSSADLGGNRLLNQSARQRARQLLEEGLAFGDRGDYRQGIARLREVVKLDPQATEAFVGMAAMFYDLGDLDRAMAAYEIALEQRPTMRAALEGAAKVFRQKNDYASAAQNLRTILRYDPNDAETWMNLGDIGVFQGDEVLARECYLRATQIDPEAAEVVAQARKRLALMTEVSRTYRGVER